ncbi:glycosyltransferase family 2 protein [Candidatus Albibeggiatoa sp. nov. NOAA]|uniref:glycosyltransferase family 2 protein n=1 Tax=Candidatus Albibeggiatoa sp. nov. NOAA TaxID=3162724 RepID=UPI0033009D6B|nr:glycosyltransferase family 2 protein [Thiotrichaceae bacterium]
MKRVAIVVLNWQTWQATLACLDSLRQLETIFSITLVICDNHSENQSLEEISDWIKQHYSDNQYKIHSKPNFIKQVHLDCVLIQTGENLGFAGGMNVGIRYVLQQETYDYIWLLNNDTQVAANALDKLYQCAQQEKTGLIGSTILETDQPEIVQCAGGCRYYPWVTVFKNVYAGQTLQQLPSLPTPKLDYIYGASLFFPVSVIKQVGLLNEEYFLFYEELDYCQRLKQAGYRIAWCRDSFVYHQGSASIGQVKQNIRAKLQKANYYENLSTLKYTANFYPLRLPIVMLLRFSLKALVLLLRRDFDLLPALFKAYKDFLYLKLFKKG